MAVSGFRCTIVSNTFGNPAHLKTRIHATQVVSTGHYICTVPKYLLKKKKSNSFPINYALTHLSYFCFLSETISFVFMLSCNLTIPLCSFIFAFPFPFFVLPYRSALLVLLLLNCSSHLFSFILTLYLSYFILNSSLRSFFFYSLPLLYFFCIFFSL